MHSQSTAALSQYKRFLLHLGSLSDASWKLLEETLEVRSVRKNECIVEEGKTCKFIDYIHAGCFRTYHLTHDGRETTTALNTESSFVTDMKSLSQGLPSELFIEALEPSVVVRLYKAKLIGLYKEAQELETLGRRILETMVVASDQWKQMYTLYAPQERYAFMLSKAPELLNRVSLQHVASFLGIRRETLSRIRAKKTS